MLIGFRFGPTVQQMSSILSTLRGNTKYLSWPTAVQQASKGILQG